MEKLIEIQIKQGILVSYYPEPIEIDINVAKKIINMRRAAQTKDKQDVIVHLKNVKHISYEAKNYLNNEGINGLRKGAFIIQNKFEQTIFDLFLKPDTCIVANIFQTEEKAIKWLTSCES